jgi:hypothetical protein
VSSVHMFILIFCELCSHVSVLVIPEVLVIKYRQTHELHSMSDQKHTSYMKKNSPRSYESSLGQPLDDCKGVSCLIPGNWFFSTCFRYGAGPKMRVLSVCRSSPLGFARDKIDRMETRPTVYMKETLPLGLCLLLVFFFLIYFVLS